MFTCLMVAVLYSITYNYIKFLVIFYVAYRFEMDIPRCDSPMPMITSCEKDNERDLGDACVVTNDYVPYVSFAVDPSKLQTHLETPFCTPTPQQIITQLALRSERPSGNVELIGNSHADIFKSSQINSKLRRSFRTTSLRVFAFYQWNFAKFDTSVPLHLVNLLLNELICITDETQNSSKNNKSLGVTAKILYHSWSLKVHLENLKLQKPPAVPVNIQPNMCSDAKIQYSNQLNATLKMMADKAEANADQLDVFLNQKDYEVENAYYMHSCSSLIQASNQAHKSELYAFSPNQVRAHVHFLIGKLKFRKMEMKQAAARFETVCSLHQSASVLKSPSCALFAIDLKELHGFCLALGIEKVARNISDGNVTLHPAHVLLKAMSDKDYRKIVDVLLEDNICKQVSEKRLTWRSRVKIVEELIEQPQFKFQAVVCNVVYSVFKYFETAYYSEMVSYENETNAFFNELQSHSASDIAFLFMVLSAKMKNSSGKSESIKFLDPNMQNILSQFLTKVLLSIDHQVALKYLKERQSPVSDVLSAEDCRIISAVISNPNCFDLDDLEASLETPVKSSDSSLQITGNATIKRMIFLENEIIMEPNIEKTKELLNQYIQMPNARPIIVHSESWIPKIWLDRIKTIATHDSYYRSFVPLALGKSFRFLSLGEYRISHDWFLSVAQLTNQVLGMIPGQPQPLTVALEWEALHARLSDAINSNQKLTEDLIQKCMATLFNYIGNGNIFDIRSEIVETCVISLLNSSCFQQLADLTQFRLKIVRVGVILAKFKQQMATFNVPKFDGCKDLFGLVLELHKSNGDDHSKRIRMGTPAADVSVDRPMCMRDNFILFVTRLTDVFVLDCLVACIVRLYNVLNSENLLIELTSALLNEGGGAWRQLFIEQDNLPNVPKTVANTERTLEQVLEHVLYKRKNGMANASWVKTYLELQIAKENYLVALKLALAHGCKITNFFTLPSFSSTNSSGPERIVWKPVWNDDILQLIIRCCEKLLFLVYTALFAQMMMAPMYEKIYGHLGKDGPRMTRDAGDTLYKYIFDKTILECIINAHTSRGELEKAEVAICQMNRLDLNDFNSNEAKTLVSLTYSYEACLYMSKLLL